MVTETWNEGKIIMRTEVLEGGLEILAEHGVVLVADDDFGVSIWFKEDAV